MNRRTLIKNRWNAVQQGWLEILTHPNNSEQMMTWMIELDAFLGFSQTNNFNELSELTKELLKAIEDIDDIDPDVVKEIIERVNHYINTSDIKSIVVEHHGCTTYQQPLLLLVGYEDSDIEHLTLQMEHFGYVIQTIPNVQNLSQECIRRRVTAVMVSMDTQSNHPKFVEEIERIKEAQINWIASSSDDSFHTRLLTVRYGALTFLRHPLSPWTLVDVLDRSLEKRDNARDMKVLVVEDSFLTRNFIKKTLSEAGIEVILLMDPTLVLQSIKDHHPDMILLDFYMTECSGLEIAQIIRQHDQFVSIPIVYLSSETNTDIHLNALDKGGDDFLMKPIDPQTLTSMVISKIQRYQMMRKLMLHDSLTGLLNHTRVKQQLDTLMFKVVTEKSLLTFAMVDIDHFKKVNDTYGHPVGDRVIKTLARLLKQRLTHSDIVGRYGGEEFAVIMYGVTPARAYEILNTIREDFSRIYHYHDGGVFNSTYSCGLASSLYFKTPADITAAADAALYESKRNGRNQITIAEHKK